MSRQSINRSVCGIEALEVRQLLAAYSAAEYFPLAAGVRWTYTGQYDGHTATCARTSTRVGSGVQIDDRTTVSGQRVVLSRTYSLSGGSLGISRQVMSGGDMFGSELTITPALAFLPASFGTGRVSRWTGNAISAVIHVPDYGEVRASGVENGTTTVQKVGRMEIAGWVFDAPLKVTVNHTQTVQATIEGIPVKLVNRIVEVAYLARNVGMIQGSTDITATVSDNAGHKESVSVDETISLVGSSLLKDFTRVSSGLLTVSGTAGADNISIENSGGSVLAIRNGTGRRISAAVTRVRVLGNKGNDLLQAQQMSMPVLLYGEDGSDTLRGGIGDDLLDGGNGNDSMDARAGNDTLVGGNGADSVVGGVGNDILVRTESSDKIPAGAGFDFELNFDPKVFSRSAINQAVAGAATWHRLFVSELPNRQISGKTVDDVKLNFVLNRQLTLPSKSASFTITSGLPYGGTVQLHPDAYSLAAFGKHWPTLTAVAAGTTIGHEVGHVLGFSPKLVALKGLVATGTGGELLFTGAAAVEQYNLQTGAGAAAVPLEQNANVVHWCADDACLKTEIMCPGGTAVGPVTRGALADMGYDVIV